MENKWCFCFEDDVASNIWILVSEMFIANCSKCIFIVYRQYKRIELSTVKLMDIIMKYIETNKF